MVAAEALQSVDLNAGQRAIKLELYFLRSPVESLGGKTLN
jgi:hypothetical protein